MALGGCASCIKYCLFVFNLLFWLIGCALVGVGIWIVVDARKFIDVITSNVPSDIQTSLGTSSEETVKILGIIAIVIGGVVLILGFLGCCGAIRENQAMLALFFTFLLLIFAALIAVGILVFVYSDKLKGWLRDVLDKEAETNVNNGLLVYANSRWDCCGIDDVPALLCPRAYPPTSKCEVGSPKCGKGCFTPLWEGLNNMKFGLGIALLVSGGVMIFGMIFAMCLCCSIRSNNYD